MRRPLKPFVTEYKGTNRRPKDGAGVFGAEPDPAIAEAPTRKTTKSAEPRTASPKAATSTRRGEAQRSTDTPRYNGAPAEDSYEAAMRAADALFSGAPPREASPQVEAVHAHDVFSKQESMPQPGAETPSGSGRILRVLDEAPDPAILAMEAERTPKRRGRKPGSKNKPKSLPDGHSFAPTAAPPEPARAVAGSSDHGDTPPGRSLPSAVVYFPAMPSRSGERFAWVRTKLKPGEAWKRRLPKVIW